ncbi:MAG: RpiB/LacA/LacB family sugar-phosphate isomerase [Spirochaetales bacterium]|nr:RpiB/LacA/LacB family sugar-phosphate isomerase [Spirochaetales bacterium]
MPKVVVANDHGAVELTARIVDFLRQRGFEVNYLGTTENKSVDYPDMAELACTEFKKGDYEFGVLCCGTGIGISISANKIKGIRCALPQNSFAARMAKEHNAANFIAFGGRIDYQEDVLDMLAAYIDAQISQEERHARRRAKMMFLEN